MGPTEIPSQSTETIKIPTAHYEFGANYIDPHLMLIGRVLTDDRLNARMKCDLTDNLSLKANAQLMLIGRVLTDGRLNARMKCDLTDNLSLKANAQVTRSVVAISRNRERNYFYFRLLRGITSDWLDWLEAIKTRDPIQIREAQLKIIERRGEKVSGGLNSERKGNSRTPGSTFMRNFSPFDEFDAKAPNVEFFDEGGGNEQSEIDTTVTLEEFFRRCDYLLEGEKNEYVKSIEDVKRDKNEYACLLLLFLGANNVTVNVTVNITAP